MHSCFFVFLEMTWNTDFQNIFCVNIFTEESYDSTGLKVSGSDFSEHLLC